MPARLKRACRIMLLAAVTAVMAGGAAATGGVATLPSAHTADSHASSRAAAADARFAVGSAALIAAEGIAVGYWHTAPCSGVFSVVWASLDPSINASSTWWNPVAAYGNAAANTRCTIRLNSNRAFDWPMFCTVMVHEMGHLTGHQHVTDPANVMYPVYRRAVPQCTGSPPTASAAVAHGAHA